MVWTASARYNLVFYFSLSYIYMIPIIGFKMLTSAPRFHDDPDSDEDYFSNFDGMGPPAGPSPRQEPQMPNSSEGGITQ